ncbi:MAG: TIGR01459 family HAD-type hydrolase [Candidatus Paracaedibacteraceae bacterium]|nr:TIGR01459 family HAD-type hydrolase [Candidatus Paracaedibacteraceae bacterium]
MPTELKKQNVALNEIESLMSIADKYDVILIDVWGVTHNGVAPFPKAIAAYEKLKEMGKTLVILSNAPRLPGITRTRLSDMGIDDTLFDDVMTSGLECHEALRDRSNAFYQKLGTKLFHIGPARDRTVFEGLPYVSVDSVDDADFLLITGTDGWHFTTDIYNECLGQAHARNLPAVCANADELVQIGEQLVICAGAIAEAYCALGANDVYIHGKPDVSLFEKAHALANINRGEVVPLSRVLMLGDSLATDIRGSNRYGIDCVFTLSGVHAEVAPEMWTELFESYQVTPTYVMRDGIA